MGEILLAVQNVTHRYGQSMALKEVNLRLERGQIYGLVGNNGAGKTTLMRLITGQAVLKEGEIRLFGQKGKKELCAMRRRTGALIEAPGFYEDLSAEQKWKSEIRCWNFTVPA